MSRFVDGIVGAALDGGGARGLVTGEPRATRRGTWAQVHDEARRIAAALGELATPGSAVAVLAADTEFHENLPRMFPHAPGAKDMWAGDDAFRTENAKLNATLQVAYFILGVRAAGLAAGPMTGFDAAGINAEFFPDGNKKVLVVVNIGKPGAYPWFDRLPRHDYEEIVTEV